MNPKQKILSFSYDTKVHELISSDYSSLLIMNRFGIPLGVGDSTIYEICKKYNVDIDTLFIVLKVTRDDRYHPTESELAKVNLDSLITYLNKSHQYFLDFRLPTMRGQLIDAIKDCPREISIVIQKFFDEYVIEVNKHMGYEDNTVFTYARKLESGVSSNSYNIGIFSRRHDQIEQKITELKNIIIKYYPATTNYGLTLVINDIFACEEDLAAHNRVEDFVFIPYIKMLEDKVKSEK